LPDEAEDEAQAEARVAARAVLTVVGNAYGIDSLPTAGPGAPPTPLGDVGTSSDVLEKTPLLSDPAKLALLRELVRAPERNDGALSIARSLLRSDIAESERDGVARQLVARVFEISEISEPGRDPLGRSPGDLVDPGGLVTQLKPDIQELAITMVPKCDTTLVQVGTTVALSIETTAWSTKPIQDFYSIIDPRMWPACPVMHTFFRSMDYVDPPSPPPPGVPLPDEGWEATLREVVDFSFGFGWPPLTTDLKVVHFHDTSRVGSTYDLGYSVDNRITVDQGYLLAEDLPIRGRRRIKTLKQVHFAAGNVPVFIVCPVWSITMAALAWSCV
jgi:hypothetical protein